MISCSLRTKSILVSAFLLHAVAAFALLLSPVSMSHLTSTLLAKSTGPYFAKTQESIRAVNMKVDAEYRQVEEAVKVNASAAAAIQ
jgi:hypothetical protein